MRKLLIYLKDYRKECILGPLFKLLEASFELGVPLVVARIIDVAIPAADRSDTLRLCLLLVGLGLVGFLSAVTAQYFAAKAACGFAKRLKHALFAHLQTLSHTELDGLGTSTMITRMTSDMNQLQTGVNMALRLFLRSPFVVFGAMIMAFTIDVQAALIFALTIPVLTVCVFAVILGCMPLYRRVQERLDGILKATRENLTGVRVIRAFRLEEAEQTAFEQKNRRLADLQRLVGRISGLMNPLTYVLLNAAILGLIYVGALRVDAGVLSQGAVFALYNYMLQILVELIKLANLIVTLTKAAACGNRVAAVFTAENTLTPGSRTEIPASDEAVRFDDVTLQYKGAGAPSLHHISFVAKTGETVGVIGATGSGKSSLVQLIPRFYDATEGTVSVWGVPVRDYQPDALRATIRVVPQRSVLFQGTIRENLCWGDPAATDETLWQALTMAQASDFVSALDGKLSAPVAQGGSNFSGGQRQRLAIARALVGRPNLLILDDSFSALDYATDAALRRAIREMPGSPTVFLVSQRASTIRYADRIIVLEDGCAVGVGSHDELIETCPVYREICASQSEGGKAE